MQVNAQDVRNACRRAVEAMRDAEDALNMADAQLGDGDTGQTMRRVLEAVSTAADGEPEGDLGGLFRKLGMAGMAATGSSLGTLVSVGLLEFAKVLRGREDTDINGLIAALDAAEITMLTRGNTQLGDKTALDMLHAIGIALKANPSNAAKAIGEATHSALEAFRNQPCRAGRARMFAERSVGMDDPGMLAFARLAIAIVQSEI